MSAPVTTAEVSVGAGSLTVSRSGTPGDPAILWLHGSGTSALASWQWLLADLADHFQNVAPDLAGDPTADQLVALLDALALDQVAVVGCGTGSVGALRLAAAAPTRVSRLVVVGTPGGLPADVLAAAQPTSIVHGTEDPVVPVAAARELDEQLADGQLHLFPGAGHDVHLEQPQEFAILIRTFFRTDDG